MSYKEEKEYETIEDDIAALEEAIEQTDKDILANSNDFVKLNELTQKKEDLSAQLSEKLDRLMYLEELAAEISGN